MTKIKKFTAASIPEALSRVKAEMGGDALILGTSRTPSRRSRPGWVEVVAAGAATYAGKGQRRPPEPRRHLKSAKEEISAMRKLDREIVKELRQIENRLKKILDSIATRDLSESRGARPAASRDLLLAGFDPTILGADLGEASNASGATGEQLLRTITGGVRVAKQGQRILAFLGPSGSGKTTTLLKVAHSVFLSRKIKPKVVFFGGDGQDVTYLKDQCRRLRIKFSEVPTVKKMAKILGKEKAPLLIDTPSISSFGEQELCFIVEAARNIKDMGLKLVVDSTMDPWNICAIASCVPGASAIDMILTKLDEATRIGGALSASIASGMPLAFVTGGRNPADGVHVPDRELLTSKILDGVRGTHFGADGRSG
jgi:flagellar biosynthesis protein FlhF